MFQWYKDIDFLYLSRKKNKKSPSNPLIAEAFPFNVKQTPYNLRATSFSV